jgi:hypothetical protein
VVDGIAGSATWAALEPATPVPAPPVGFPVEPGTVVVIKDGSDPKPESLLWRALWAILGLIWPDRKEK